MLDSEWDVFISHANEDKSSVAKPLAEILRNAGLRVWIDAHEIKLGDSLTGKINEGLAHSKYGLVILSPQFFAKEWLKRELAALLSIEMKHGKRVLPVLHNLQFEALLADFPLIADKLCVSTATGLDAVAAEVCRAIGVDAGVAPPPTRPLLLTIGSHIGPYEIETQLGSGGSGVVYRVHSSSYRYPLALKLFHPLGPSYAHLFPLFSRGFRAVAAVCHPNVLAVHDQGAFAFRGEKRAYITMDLIDGVPLDVWCRQTDSSANRYRSVLPAFRQLATALCAAHETSYVDELGFQVNGVLHGDVKPANVLVDKDGLVRLIDFLQIDVQRLIDPRILSPDTLSPPVPITGALGTPGFMAPEQERHGVVTVATDIYGLGVTFAHALADANTSNPIFDIYRNPDISGSFRDLLITMVAPKPEQRPARVRDILSVLDLDHNDRKAG